MGRLLYQTEGDHSNARSLNTGQNMESPKIWAWLKSMPRLAMADRANCSPLWSAYLCPSMYATAYCGTNRTNTRAGSATARHETLIVRNTRRKVGKYQNGV